MNNKFKIWIAENRKGLIVGVIVGILITLIVETPLFILDQIRIASNRPTPEIIITEKDTGLLKLVFIHSDPNKAKINDLFFKLDIPGRLINYQLNELNLVDYASVDNSLLCSHGGITTAETIRIHLKNFRPEGWAKIELNYIPTFSVSTSNIEFKPSFLDLHSISKVICVWDYKSNEKLNSFYYDFSYLDYIQKDKEMLINSPLYESNKEINEMNKKRRDW